MYDNRINTAPITAELHQGFPEAIDVLAAKGAQSRSFLRSAWYHAGAQGAGHTLIGKNAEGTPIAAIPLMNAAPSTFGVHKVPGSYWPFRSLLATDDVLTEELAQLFLQKTAIKALGSIWRMGPVAWEDETTQCVARAAALAGWTVLKRPAGKTWILDLGGDKCWPSKSTAKRLRQYERRLGEHGQVAWRHVSGSQWDEATLLQMGAVERDSWVGRNTDGSGAKFLNTDQRSLWLEKLADPYIADMAQATILTLDDRPIAFSFDMICGAIQYAIACSFAEDMGQFRAGNLATHHQLQHAREQGVTTIDMGVGDMGYKRQMGAVEGDDFADILFVRNPIIAKLLAFKWGEEPEHLKEIRQTGLALTPEYPNSSSITSTAPEAALRGL